MVLYVVAPGKFYFQIRFEDVPPEYILGACCIVCTHTWPVNRHALEKKYGRNMRLVMLDDQLRCGECGNNVANSFMVFGRRLRKRSLPALPAEVEDGVPPPERSGKR